MSQKIYFPSINAEATAVLKRGGTALVVPMWDGNAYIGAIKRVRFTTSKPRNWDFRPEVDILKEIPAGGFAYKFIGAADEDDDCA